MKTSRLATGDSVRLTTGGSYKAEVGGSRPSTPTSQENPDSLTAKGSDAPHRGLSRRTTSPVIDDVDRDEVGDLGAAPDPNSPQRWVPRMPGRLSARGSCPKMRWNSDVTEAKPGVGAEDSSGLADKAEVGGFEALNHTG